MTWDPRSRRRSELPADWPIIRRDILDRDQHHCRIQGPRCTGTATEVDHVGNRFDHSRDNLRAACTPCHRQRTSQQGAAAKPSRYRQPARHPGLV